MSLKEGLGMIGHDVRGIAVEGADGGTVGHKVDRVVMIWERVVLSGKP